MKHNFDDVRDVRLQAYNRAVMSTNILQDAGRVACAEYLDQFSDPDKQLIYVILHAVESLGVDKVREHCTKGLIFEE